MSDLVVTTWTPALGSGRAARTYGVVAALARTTEVDVAFQRFDAPGPGPEYLALAPRVRLHAAEPSHGARRAATALRWIARGVPRDFARGVAPELVAVARDLAPRARRVIADGLVGAAACLPLTRERDVVYLAHNFESGFRPTPALERFERRVLEACAETWMVTEADIEGARRFAPAAGRLRLAPNVVDVEALGDPAPPPGAQRLLMVADFHYEPNREGFAFLAAEVMPLVWEQLPGARLAVAGRALDLAAPDERVELLGFVDDLHAAYAAADAVVVPLLRGGGSPLKFVEALAHGRPVVATTHAAGLLAEGTPGEHFLAAADAGALARAIVAVLRGGHPRLGAAGHELARRRYSVEALAELITA